MKIYNTPELKFEQLRTEDIMTASVTNGGLGGSLQSIGWDDEGWITE